MKIQHRYKNSLLALFILSIFSSNALSFVQLRSWDTGKTIDFNDGLDWATTSNNAGLVIEFCVRSETSTGTSTPYQVKISDSTTPGSPYTLKSPGLNDLPVKFEFSELPNNIYEQLNPNTYTAQNKNGNSSCNGAAIDNAALRLTILNSDLIAATAGTYSNIFSVTIKGGNVGSETKTAALRVRLIINPYMKISDLNDINFPFFDHINPLIASDRICIYRNNPGNYSVNARGSGTNFAFTLTNGINLLPYTLTWNDSSTTAALTANSTLLNRTNVFRNNLTCDFGTNDNATIQLTISVANINAVPQSIYTGTLTLIIAPL
jgi:hypothetical protein